VLREATLSGWPGNSSDPAVSSWQPLQGRISLPGHEDRPDDGHATRKKCDPDTFDKLAGEFDLIINTVSANIDLNALFAAGRQRRALSYLVTGRV